MILRKSTYDNEYTCNKRILVFASILIVVACINVASSKGREREAEDSEQLENIRKQKKK